MTSAPTVANRRPSLATMWRNWVVYGLSSVAGRLIGFLMLPIYTRVLSPEEYGIRAMVTVGVDLVGMVCSLGLTTAMVRYLAGDGAEEGRTDAVGTAYVTGASVLAIGAGIGLLAAPWLSLLLLGDAAHAGYVRLGLVSLFFINTMDIGLAYLRWRRRVATVTAIALTTLAMTLTANILLVVVLRWGVAGILYGEIVTYALVSAVVARLALREAGLRFCGALARRMVAYGAPLTLMPFAWLLVNRSDGVFLTHHGSLGAAGVYALAIQCAQVLLIAVITPFRDVWDPGQFDVARDPDGGRVYRRMFQTFTFTIVVAAFAFAIGAEEVIRIMAAPRFHAAAAVVPLLLTAHVITGMSLFFNSALLVRNRTGLLGAIALVTAVVNMAANALLVPAYLAAGAALARVIALAVMAVLTYVVARRLWPHRVDLVALGKVAVIAVLLFAVAQRLPQAHPLVIVPIKALLVLVLMAASLAVGAVDRAEVRRAYDRVRAGVRLVRPAATVAR